MKTSENLWLCNIFRVIKREHRQEAVYDIAIVSLVAGKHFALRNLEKITDSRKEQNLSYAGENRIMVKCRYILILTIVDPGHLCILWPGCVNLTRSP